MHNQDPTLKEILQGGVSFWDGLIWITGFVSNCINLWNYPFTMFVSRVSVCFCLCCPHELMCNKCMECPERPNLGISSLESVIKRDWKPSWGALNSTWGLCEKIKCSCIRSHLIEPELSTHNGNNITLASLWLQRLDCLRTSQFFYPWKHCWIPC